MSDLETLKAQHPELCFDCGAAKAWCSAKDGRCIAPPAFALLASFAHEQASIVQQHEATNAELEKGLFDAVCGEPFVCGNGRTHPPTTETGCCAYCRSEDAESDLAAAQATIEEFKADLSVMTQCRDDLARKLAWAEKVIQQQARELETADKALLSMDGRDLENWFVEDEIAAIRAALARHSARAISEAKKEHPHA